MKRITTILIAVLLVTMVFAGERDYQGKGTVTAQGKGVAKFRGAGSVEISGDGMLWVTDCSMKDNLEINVSGQGQKLRTPSYLHVYKGFNGTATFDGSRMKVVLSGKDIKLRVTGIGKIHLQGKGTCQKGDQVIPWSEEAETEVIVGENVDVESLE